VGNNINMYNRDTGITGYIVSEQNTNITGHVTSIT